MTEAGWIAQPGSQVAFLSCPVFECLLQGTRGGGKTDALLMDFAREVGKGYGAAWRGAIFRLTYPQLADVVSKSKRWFHLIFPGAKFNESTYSWAFPGGEQLFFRYGVNADSYWNYHGHEYPWLGFEELTNWRTADFFEAMLSTCRSSVAGVPKRVRATTNPFGVGHGWVKERYKIGVLPPGSLIGDGVRQRTQIRSTIWENSYLLAADPGYVDSLKKISDPNRRKAWLDGDWEIHVGSFLEAVWDPSRHVVNPFYIPSSWRVWKGFDWGYGHPYAALWLAMNPDGVIYVWRELYGYGGRPNVGSREDAGTVAKKINAIEENDARNGYEYRANLADPAIFSPTGVGGPSVATAMRQAGVKWIPAWNGKGSRINGAAEIVRLLAEDKLKFFSTCKHCIRTIPSLDPDPLNPEDVDSDEEDHLWDALRYAVMRKRRAPESEPVTPAMPEPGSIGFSDNGSMRIF